MFVVLSLMSVVLLLSLQKIVYDPIDANLLSKAKALDNMIDSSIDSDFKFSFSDTRGNSFQFKVSGGKLWVYSSQYSRYFFQIRSFEGKTIKKSISLGDKSLPFNKKFKKIETIKADGKVVRLLNYIDNKNKIIVQVAYNAKNEDDILNNVTFISLVAILFIMLTSSIGGFLVSKKALKPIDEISNDIKKITDENLGGTIELEDAPDELKTLITSFNDMLKRLDNSFKQQKRFLSDVSHELKTPISVIMMQSELVLRKDRTPDEYKKAFFTISNTSSMMSNLIEKMLFMARLDSKHNKISFEKNAINDIVKNAIELLRHNAEDKNIKINLHENAMYEIDADKTSLLEVFINLIDNAIKYNKENGTIDIYLNSEMQTLLRN
jgi:signal transduction histidine kinase